MTTDRYHVALSFAGEDRQYVELVAARLRELGVSVFYDKFEETKLWGKNLYTYLSDVYQNQAMYTVIFVSAAYKNRLWTNHERESAQARAFAESKDYVLPAVFDETVEIPGILKTTAYLNIASITPEHLAQKIVDKLRGEGVFLGGEDKFDYPSHAKADIDFPLSEPNDVTRIITELKTYNWYKQGPAIERMLAFEWTKLSPEQIFVLGRNVYQCACGGERKAAGILKELRRTLAKLPPDAAEHFLNGLFYEIYFDAKGRFRGPKLKSNCISEVFAIQQVDKYESSVRFISRALQPYRDSLAVLPSRIPEPIRIRVTIEEKDPPLITSLECRGRQILVAEEDADSDTFSEAWRLSFRKFTLESLVEVLSRAWHVPREQLVLELNGHVKDGIEVRLPENRTIARLTLDDRDAL